MDLVYDEDQCHYCGDEKITCGINARKNGKLVAFNFCSDKCRCIFIKENEEKKKGVTYGIMK